MVVIAQTRSADVSWWWSIFTRLIISPIMLSGFLIWSIKRAIMDHRNSFSLRYCQPVVQYSNYFKSQLFLALWEKISSLWADLFNSALGVFAISWRSNLIVRCDRCFRPLVIHSRQAVSVSAPSQYSLFLCKIKTEKSWALWRSCCEKKGWESQVELTLLLKKAIY